MIKYRPQASPVTQICISLHFSSLISGPRTVKFLFLIASCLQNTDVGGIYQVIAIKTKNIQQGPTLNKTPIPPTKVQKWLFWYFLDLKFFTLRMLWPIINPEMKFLTDQRWRHNMSWVLIKTRASQQHEHYYYSVIAQNTGLLSPGTNGVSAGQQSLMTAFLRVCVFFTMTKKSM